MFDGSMMPATRKPRVYSEVICQSGHRNNRVNTVMNPSLTDPAGTFTSLCIRLQIFLSMTLALSASSLRRCALCNLRALTEVMSGTLALAANWRSNGKSGGVWKGCSSSFAISTCAFGVNMDPFGLSSGMSIFMPFLDKCVPCCTPRLAARWALLSRPFAPGSMSELWRFYFFLF